MYRYTYDTYDPYSTSSAYYAYTTTVPTYHLNHTLQSLSAQQARIHAQREALEEEERRVRRYRQATLRRMRAQRLREVMEEQQIEDIVTSIVERDRIRTMDDGEIAEAVMYCPFPKRFLDTVFRLWLRILLTCREILKQNDPRKVARGWGGYGELQRELQVREMVDPSPRSPQAESATPIFHIRSHHKKQPSPTPEYMETPVINELPTSQKDQGFLSPPPEYFQEPSLKNKRGSRRTSFRRDSHSSETPLIPTAETAIVSASQTLTSYALLRTKLQNELSSITIRSDVKPTFEQRKVLHHHMSKLEDILDEVDAVPTPTDTSVEGDIIITRKARREIVSDIVGAIDGIERFITPDTPTTPAEPASVEATDEESDGESDGAFNEEIQRVIRETLARKKDEEVATVGSGRRSVTIEDVPDAEY